MSRNLLVPERTIFGWLQAASFPAVALTANKLRSAKAAPQKSNHLQRQSLDALCNVHVRNPRLGTRSILKKHPSTFIDPAQIEAARATEIHVTCMSAFLLLGTLEIPLKVVGILQQVGERSTGARLILARPDEFVA